MEHHFFKFVVTEVSYLDDYTDGQIGSENSCKCDEKKFDTLEEGLEWFKDNYCEDGKMYVISDYTLANTGKIMSEGIMYGFEEASDKEIDAWKNGEIRLWNVEYQVAIEEQVIKDVNVNEFSNEFNKKFNIDK